MGLSANNIGVFENSAGVFGNSAGVFGNSAGVLNTDLTKSKKIRMKKSVIYLVALLLMVCGEARARNT